VRKLAALALLGLPLLALAQAGPRDLRAAIDAAHDVPWIETAALAERMQRPGLLLLDVRTEDEFATSHLRGAVRVDPDRPNLDALPDADEAVVYCSVGWRSAAVGEQLEARGVRVRNLAGGIFAWANEGRPVYREGRRVNDVHPYDATWGRLLDASHRAQLSRTAD